MPAIQFVAEGNVKYICYILVFCAFKGVIEFHDNNIYYVYHTVHIVRYMVYGV